MNTFLKRKMNGRKMPDREKLRVGISPGGVLWNKIENRGGLRDDKDGFAACELFL